MTAPAGRLALAAAAACLLACALPAVSAPPRGPQAAGTGTIHSGALDELQRLVAAGRGRPFLLTFWATWCAPCVDEVPAFNEALRRFAPRGLSVLGVSFDRQVVDEEDQGLALVKEFVRRHRIAYDTFYYTGDIDPIHDAYDLPGPIPHTLVFDGDGDVVLRIRGKLDPETLLTRIGAAIGAAP